MLVLLIIWYDNIFSYSLLRTHCRRDQKSKRSEAFNENIRTATTVFRKGIRVWDWTTDLKWNGIFKKFTRKGNAIKAVRIFFRQYIYFLQLSYDFIDMTNLL